nr:PLP-dependent aminotransferase family protein [uncultured Dyadobacter sp.]
MLRPWELFIPIDKGSDKPVYMQIAEAMIAAVKTGQLKGGDALPGSRQLAAQLKVNRNTIVAALDVLIAEGWLVSRERTGIFVPVHMPVPAGAPLDPQIVPGIATALPKPDIFFDDGLPDSTLAPITELARAYRQVFSRKGRWQMMGYTGAAGDPEFREAIAQMLNHKRGMRLRPDDVFITRGSQMAMYLAAHCLLQKGDYVLVESPGYQPAWRAFEQAGATLLPVRVDAQGLVAEELKPLLDKYPGIRAVYITPHHQFPTTVTLTLARRLELVRLSNEYQFTIIEDDYDHEFHFSSRPVMPVCSLEGIQHYVYVGTMSKIAAPALRMGYLASSPDFVQKVADLRKIIDVQGDNVMEQAVLQLIRDGEIKRHLKRATSRYKAKRDRFEKLLTEQLGDKIRFTRPEGGLAFWIEPKTPVDLCELIDALRRERIAVLPPETFGCPDIRGLRLGYASLTEEQLETGIKAMARLWPS